MNQPPVTFPASRVNTLKAERKEITAHFLKNEPNIDWSGRAQRSAEHRATVTYPYGPKRGSCHWENGRLVTKGFGS